MFTMKLVLNTIENISLVKYIAPEHIKDLSTQVFIYFLCHMSFSLSYQGNFPPNLF